jgi:hypothetical protein
MRILISTYPKQIAEDTSLEGKFLQLRLAGQDWLLFAVAAEHSYHNQILGRFLSEQGIPHHWENPEDLVVDHPELAVIGGGRFLLNFIGKTLRVWDESSVYGRFDAAALSAQLTLAAPPWDRLTLSVG